MSIDQIGVSSDRSIEFTSSTDITKVINGCASHRKVEEAKENFSNEVKKAVKRKSFEDLSLNCSKIITDETLYLKEVKLPNWRKNGV